MTTVTKQPKKKKKSRGGAQDVKDIYPVKRAWSLKLKLLLERPSLLLALWWALTQYGAKETKAEAEGILSNGSASQ